MLDMHTLLVQTRNALAQRGHAKHELQDATGKVCIYGAFNFVITGHPLAFTTGSRAKEFAQILGFNGNQPVMDCVHWNNDPSRTEEEVLARLDDAIARTAPAPEDIQLSEETKREEVCV